MHIFKTDDTPHHIYSERLYPFILSPIGVWFVLVYKYFVYKWVLFKNKCQLGKSRDLTVSFAFFWLQLMLKF